MLGEEVCQSVRAQRGRTCLRRHETMTLQSARRPPLLSLQAPHAPGLKSMLYVSAPEMPPAHTPPTQRSLCSRIQPRSVVGFGASASMAPRRRRKQQQRTLRRQRRRDVGCHRFGFARRERWAGKSGARLNGAHCAQQCSVAGDSARYEGQ